MFTAARTKQKPKLSDTMRIQVGQTKKKRDKTRRVLTKETLGFKAAPFPRQAQRTRKT